MINLSRDDARRRVTGHASGVLTVEDMRRTVELQRDAGAWGYSVLYDLRAARAEVNTADLRALADIVEHFPDPSGRGPIAVVAVDPVLYGTMCVYSALMARLGVRLQVFRAVPEAEDWLQQESR
jgi:hypothetical protein